MREDDTGEPESRLPFRAVILAIISLEAQMKPRRMPEHRILEKEPAYTTRPSVSMLLKEGTGSPV